jgi:TolB-like protein/Tfp pilus assembly protein PilF
MLDEGKPEARGAERAASVREHLQEVLRSDAFKGGKRAQDFLQLVVEHALAGRLDNLRERMLGAEMFGRPIDYDTANDAVVRVKATEVRKRLNQYYQSLPAPPPVRIELSAGSYVPQFIFEVPPTADPATSTASGPSQAETRAEPPPGVSVASGAATRAWPARLATSAWMLPVAGLVILAAAGFFTIQRWKHLFSPQQIRSIAILPLINLSGDPSQEYFADGMTEELTTELGQVSSLRVISRTSTMTYKGTKKTLPEIAGELHVDGIVEGSIGREGNRIRITTQLIDSRTDQHIWAHSYDRDMTSVLQLQSDVARAIADQVRIELSPQEQARLSRTQRVNPEAVELYLQAVQRLNSGNPRPAIDFLRQAIQKDPNYAPAHASLANAYGWMGEGGWMPYAEAFSQQKAEALKAIEIDDSRPEPHLELGVAAMNESWDWATQRKEFQRALELNPNAATVHWAYANYLGRVGRQNEAISEARLALQLDPVSSRSFMNTGFIYYFARQYDQALTQMQQSAELGADPIELLFPLGDIYVEKGLYDQGIQEFQKLGDAPHALGHIGNAYARQGRLAEARALLPRLTEHIDKTGIGRYEIALVYAGLKENDNAFAWLEKAYQSHDKGLTYLKIDPCLDPLRSDPRFQDLVKRVGIPS